MEIKSNPYKNVLPNFKLSDLLIETTEKSNETFWLRNSYNKRYIPTKELWMLIEKAGCVYSYYRHGDKYEVSPDDIFFEIVHDCLFYQYQSIIGGRRLAFITDLEEIEGLVL